MAGLLVGWVITDRGKTTSRSRSLIAATEVGRRNLWPVAVRLCRLCRLCDLRSESHYVWRLLILEQYGWFECDNDSCGPVMQLHRSTYTLLLRYKQHITPSYTQHITPVMHHQVVSLRSLTHIDPLTECTIETPPRGHSAGLQITHPAARTSRASAPRLAMHLNLETRHWPLGCCCRRHRRPL
eukprot:COSAG01_NODE_6461_length_3655_cov_20.982565_3_plen_183_part_00